MATTVTNCSTLESSSLKQVVIALDYPFGSTVLTNFYRTVPKFKINSTIIVKDNIVLSNELIYHTKHENQSIPPQLLYRGSRDGFKSIDFHSRCDNQGPTLTIIKSSEPYNQIFGGFTTQSWKLSGGQYISDSSAFIFKIDENNQFRKFNIQPDKKQFAIYSDTNFLPTFGAGCDINIFSDCNVNNYSYSYFGYSYELPPPSNNEYECGREKARTYLAGSYKFKVSEIEVFKIITTTTIQQQV